MLEDKRRMTETRKRGSEQNTSMTEEQEKMAFLRQAVCWSEILGKPACRQRREAKWQSRSY